MLILYFYLGEIIGCYLAVAFIIMLMVGDVYGNINSSEPCPNEVDELLYITLGWPLALLILIYKTIKRIIKTALKEIKDS
jgi:hypothetical protein